MKSMMGSDPILIIGVLISVIITLVLYSVDPQKAESSLIFGLLGIIISILLDMIKQNTAIRGQIT